MKRFLSISLTLIFLGACAGAAVTTSFDHDVHFKERKTFSFQPGLRKRAQGGAASNPQGGRVPGGADPQGGRVPGGADPQGDDQAMLINSIVRKALREAIAAQLVAKGFQQVPTGGDLVVAYYLNAKRRTNVTKSEPQLRLGLRLWIRPRLRLRLRRRSPRVGLRLQLRPARAERNARRARIRRGHHHHRHVRRAHEAPRVARPRRARNCQTRKMRTASRCSQTAKKILAGFPPGVGSTRSRDACHGELCELGGSSWRVVKCFAGQHLLAKATAWLLTKGWRRRGLIGIEEMPSS